MRDVREPYGMLAMRFGDTDVDKDGKINAVELHGFISGIGSGALAITVCSVFFIFALFAKDIMRFMDQAWLP